MSVDWSKPIEAVEKTTDRVVTVSYDGREWSEYEKCWMYRTKEVVAGNTNQNWYEDGRDWCNRNEWFVRNCVQQSPTIPVPTITVTGLPVPQGFVDVMKHTIVGADITGILITAGDRMEITTTSGATFVVSISTK